MRLRFAGARDSLELRRADSPTVSSAKPNRQVPGARIIVREKTPKRDTPRRALRGRGGETRARASSRHARLRASFASRAVRLPRRDEARRAPVPLEHRPADGSSSPVPELDGSGSLSRTGSRGAANRRKRSSGAFERDRGGARSLYRWPCRLGARLTPPPPARARVGTTRFAPDSHEETFAVRGWRTTTRRRRTARAAPIAARADGHAVRGRAGAEDGRAERPRPDAGRAARPRAARHAALPIGRGRRRQDSAFPHAARGFSGRRRERRRRRRPDRRVSARVY